MLVTLVIKNTPPHRTYSRVKGAVNMDSCQRKKKMQSQMGILHTIDLDALVNLIVDLGIDEAIETFLSRSFHSAVALSTP